MTVPASLDLPLPRWVYMPCHGGEPDRDTLERVKALVPTRFERAVPSGHPALRYGLALNDGGWFWEAHEILEAIWKVAPKGGRDRILLRACIQIANGNLKLKMKRPRAAERLFADALAELTELAVRRPDGSDGFAGSSSGTELTAAVRAVLGDLSAKADQPAFIALTI